MAFTKLRVFANCDMTLIAWQTDAEIPGCRGFAIERKVSGAAGDAADGFIQTYVGFQGTKPDPKQPSQPSRL
jgi:hypothetical protein